MFCSFSASMYPVQVMLPVRNPNALLIPAVTSCAKAELDEKAPPAPLTLPPPKRRGELVQCGHAKPITRDRAKIDAEVPNQLAIHFGNSHFEHDLLHAANLEQIRHFFGRIRLCDTKRSCKIHRVRHGSGKRDVFMICRHLNPLFIGKRAIEIFF